MRSVILTLTVVSVAGMLLVGAINLPTKLVYNGSESSHLGFYWVDNKSLNLGDFVLMKAPESVQDLIEMRRYLPSDVPLVKRIVAIGGDKVCRNDRDILINGIGMGVAKTEDNFGRVLPDWQGCEVLSQNQIFVLQFHPDSFDGRYFGPVDRSLIIGRATWLSFPWAN